MTLGLGPLCCSPEGVSLSHEQHLRNCLQGLLRAPGVCRCVKSQEGGPGRQQAPVWKLWLYNHMWGSF